MKIRFYTDPLCCWSYAFEQHWSRLLEEFGEQISYDYVLCGMIPDWNSYNDPMNSVSKPFQMGPVWMHASEVTHVKMRHSIWFEDPPVSSYPPCIAVKTAELQSKDVGEAYLRKLRKALMEDGQNISKTDVLFAMAKELDGPEFSVQRFSDDWKAKRGLNNFREDIRQARFHNIGRYPTLTMTNESGKGIMMTGYRPFNVLRDAFLHARDELEKT